MEKKKKSIGLFIIISALIWGAVIVASAYVLKGTECYDKVQNVLIGGVFAHMFFIWGPLALVFKKTKESSSDS